jgi:hypothetical protein
MSAINSALSAIDEIATEGDLTLDVADLPLELDAVGDPVTLPDGRRIYPPRLHGEPIDELACKLLDLDRPARDREIDARPGDRIPAVAATRPRRGAP